MIWLVAVVVAAAVGGIAASETEESSGGAKKLGCFCDCMANRCMTLGVGADKFGCATACNQACTQIGKPGQPRDDDFCGF
ncbi:hypothetical protein PR202_ga25813 [Eleusine coracana subsp. coracana]|uniref:Uncharacterized protein n=1 Tax=Eleusine coracana subsp. coracana TaxID=191504 RepID=A0AAV5DBP4_ELECO|nr:hypothetical protein PR202_ga25813 [Eleusine coracana subsp. coracana]